MTTTTTPEPKLDGVLCLAFSGTSSNDFPVACLLPAAAWVTAGSGRFPACEKHAAGAEQPEEALVGTLELAGPTAAQSLRLSALDQALRAQTEHEQATQTVDRARAFYAFLAAAEQPPSTEVHVTKVTPAQIVEELSNFDGEATR